MIRETDEGYWIEHEQLIAAHHDEVFSCLTTNDGLSRWFPLAASVELRQGGLIKLSWDPGFSRTTSIAILDYDAAGSIVWDWQVARSDAHAPLYWLVRPVLEKGSRLGLRQGPFREDDESLIAMAEEAEASATRKSAGL